MSALTAARKSLQMGTPELVLPASIDVPLKANAKPFVGGVVAVDSTGYGIAGTTGVGLFCAGILMPKAGYAQQYDNTGGASGAIVAKVQQGVFAMHVGTSADALAQADYLQPVFLMDDNTVGKTDGGATPRPLAGIFMGFAPNGTDAFVLISASLNALLLAARRTGESQQLVTAISAAGAINPASDLVLATVTGTTAYTLADGTKIGHRLRVVLISGASTPVGTITPATPRGFATATALGATGDMVEFEWTATGWIPGASNGITWT